jgi:hypothetical protein
MSIGANMPLYTGELTLDCWSKKVDSQTGFGMGISDSGQVDFDGGKRDVVDCQEGDESGNG